MSSNPPITAIPAAKADPQAVIKRYRLLQQPFAHYYAQLGREEIQTPVGPTSFSNYLPPTPTHSSVASPSSKSSRARGLVARMQPRNPRPPSAASQQPSTPVPATTKAPIIYQRRTAPLDFQVAQVLADTQLPQPEYAPKRKLEETKKQTASRKKPKPPSSSESEVDEVKAALLRQRTGRRRAKAAILKPRHGGAAADTKLETEEGAGAVKRRGLQDKGAGKEQNGGGHRRLFGMLHNRGRGTNILESFRPNNVGGAEGRITVSRTFKPLGFLIKGKTSVKVSVPAVKPATSNFPAFDEAAFLNRAKSKAGGSSAATSLLEGPEIVYTEEPKMIYTAPVPSAQHMIAQAAPPLAVAEGPVEFVIPSPSSSLLLPEVPGHPLYAAPEEQPTRPQTPHGACASTSVTQARPPTRSVHVRRPRRRAFKLPQRDSGTPCFGEGHNLPGQDILGFLTPNAVGWGQVAAQDAYLDELSLDSYEQKLWPQEHCQGDCYVHWDKSLEGGNEGIPLPPPVNGRNLVGLEEDGPIAEEARKLYRPRPI